MTVAPVVYWNGSFVAPDEARVSIFDFGYLYGDGVFETLRAYEGLPFRLDAHLERLFRGLRTVRIGLPQERDELAQLVQAALLRFAGPDADVRIAVSRGLGKARSDPASCGPPALSIVVSEHVAHPEECYRDGIETTLLAAPTVDEGALAARIKGASRQDRVLARLELGERRLREGLLLNRRGCVAEGTVSNVFVVSGDALHTPALTCGCLDGVTRATVLESAPALGLAVHEAPLSVARLRGADEVFVTNSLIELLPVTRLDGERIGSGRPGRWTAALRRAYRRRVDAERPSS